MSPQTIHQFLLSTDIVQSPELSQPTLARTIYHQHSQSAMILDGIHTAVAEALSSLNQLENSRGSVQIVTRSQMDTEEHIRRLRSHVESISQMADNFGEKLCVLFSMMCSLCS